MVHGEVVGWLVGGNADLVCCFVIGFIVYDIFGGLKFVIRYLVRCFIFGADIHEI